MDTVSPQLLSRWQRLLVIAVSKLPPLLPWLAFAIVGIWMYRPLMDSSLGSIDDHEFITYLRSAHQAHQGLFSVIAENHELGNWGDGLRFRPLYQVLRVLGVFVVGDRADLRYGIRIIEVLGVCAIVAIAATKLAEGLTERRLSPTARHAAGAMFATILLCLAPWADIVTRLGPSEMLLMVGVALMALALARLPTSSIEMTWESLALALGGLFIAAGAKENGTAYLAFVVALILLYGFPARRRVMSYVALGATAGWCLWIFVGVWLALSKSGVDVYGNERSSRQTLRNLEAALGTTDTRITLAASVIILVGAQRSRARLTVAVVLFLLTVTLADQTLYGASLWTALRYSIAVKTISALAIFLASAVALSRLRWSCNHRRERLMQFLAALCCVGFLLGYVRPMIRTAKTIHSASVHTQFVTSEWEKLVRRETAVVIDEEVDQIIINITHPDYFERTYSFIQFLSYHTKAKVSFFLTVSVAPEAEGGLNGSLTAMLVDMSTRGNPAWEITPISEYRPSTHTLCYGAPFYYPSEMIDCAIERSI